MSPCWGRETQAGAPLPFFGICAIMLSTRGFGFKNLNFGAFSLGQEVPQNRFLAAVAKAAA
jgi:hypothetical protein